VSVTYLFLAEYTKSKVAITPANAPTIDIVDAANPTGALLVNDGSPTVMTNMAGVYVYAFTTDTLTYRPVGLFHTADTTVDLQDIPSYPQVLLDANNNVLVSLQSILGTLLTETVGGYLAAGLKKLLDVASPVFTLASKNQSADNDTKLTSIQADYARRTGDYATAGAQMDLVNAPNATAVAAIQSGLATSANQTTILNRIGAFTGSGLNTILGFLRALARKTAALTPSDMGGDYDNTTDSLEAAEAEHARIGAGTVIVTQPVSSSGDVEITQGDDYYNADSRALEWMPTLDGDWPDLTGATVNFYSASFDHAVTVVNPVTSKKIRIELSAAETLAAATGEFSFVIRAALATTGHVATLAVGHIKVNKRIT
jgi:hypothetical protein